jgi:DNA-directed RNA polymerase subunit M/transcription elongation factor TFIIS
VFPVIFFFCSECREELEAEDSIRGAKMKCPACFKEIEVPQASVKVTGRHDRKEKEERGGGHAAPAGGAVPEGSRFILIVLAVGMVGLFVIAGVGYTLHQREKRREELSRPRCDGCQGKKVVKCALCAGVKQQPCKECSGSGKRKNFRDEDEVCYVCSGAGRLDCRVCTGRGEYSCSACGGRGYIVSVPESR